MTENIVIYGAGPFAKLMMYHFHHDSPYRVCAFCVDRPYWQAEQFCDLPLLPSDTVTQAYPPSDHAMFVAIGYRVMRLRKQMFLQAKNLGYRLINYVSARANVRPDLRLGENNVIQSSCDIEPFVTIGDNNVFWTGTIVGHDAIVGHHNYISGGCGVGGNCVVGDLCFFGNNALMVNDLRIADETYLVAGAIILRDSQPASQYHGNPCKLIARHAETGIIIR